MSPWLFNIYVDGVMREVRGKVGEVGVRMYVEGRKWVHSIYLLMTVLIAENECLTRTGQCVYSVCK